MFLRAGVNYTEEYQFSLYQLTSRSFLSKDAGEILRQNLNRRKKISYLVKREGYLA